ncbi:MAG: Carbamoyltransferase [Alphaproteobacteria bacterium]|jgi:carbamoyltransferase|nr:Carbamoyltransferase [Alphaproteobacteria bacterium]
MTAILGLNAFHADSAACLVIDGKLVAAAEEERFRRLKHWAGFPQHAIAWCLAEAGLTLHDIDHVALNRDPNANMARKIAYVLRRRPSISLLQQRLNNRKQWQDIAGLFAQAFPQDAFKGAIHNIEHHEAHLASAFLVSPFEQAAVVSVDGFGDFSSAAWATGEGNRMDVLGRVFFPHSLGILYEAVTQFLGFENYGDEYKVMGLAPYGEPTCRPAFDRVVKLKSDGGFELDLRYFTHAKEGANYQIRDGVPSGGRLYAPALAELLGPARGPGEALDQRHRDIARSLQMAYEDAFFNLLEAAYRKTDAPCLALAGGCAYNSVANGKIYERSPFVHCYVQSAAGDAGGAIGSAYAVWHRLEPKAPRQRMTHAYYGPSFDRPALEAALEERRADLRTQDCRIEIANNEHGLCTQVAGAIAEGKVIGWFQGRMEWGPRALGNRSILADPRRADMKDILNSKIKRRESFRPFAPSVLREHVAEWFETDDDVPFMMQVYRIQADKRAAIPAVTHVDGTGRLQTVTADTNPRYARLIESFRQLTGVPMVLNTSFNENEPVVCRPQEAIDCFLRTRMDMLVLGDIIVSR